MHGVAALDRLAALTRHPEFAHLKLNELRGRYKWTGARLDVSELHLEAKKLIRIEGAFVIEADEIRREISNWRDQRRPRLNPWRARKVFTTSRDGYFWDLDETERSAQTSARRFTQRLVAAA